LFTGVFGWTGQTRTVNHPTLGPSLERVYDMPGVGRLLLREGSEPVTGGGESCEDHLGFSVDGAELDRLLAGTLAVAARESRVELRHVVNGHPSEVDLGGTVFRTFFVRFLVPLWFQFESFESVAR